MPASDIPGYIQGYRFANESAYYDSVNKRFLDQAGYGSRADLRVTVGSPVFATVDGNDGVLLDNTWHGLFNVPISFMGSIVVAMKPNYVSGGTLARYAVIGGDTATPSTNPVFYLLHFSGERRVVMAGASGATASTQKRNDNNLVVLSYANDQSTRKGYSTPDGITVTEVAGPVSSTNGNGIGLQTGQYGARFGNLSGTAGDTAELTDFNAYMYELHFFAGNILTDALTETKAFMDELKTAYGV